MNPTRQKKMVPIAMRPDLTVMVPTHDGPWMKAKGKFDYVCPNCGHVLAEDVPSNVGDLLKRDFVTPAKEGIVVQCAKCETLSSFPLNIPDFRV